eukprot:IDg20929t1
MDRIVTGAVRAVASSVVLIFRANLAPRNPRRKQLPSTWRNFQGADARRKIKNFKAARDSIILTQLCRLLTR